jgi:hypothetical protein
VHARGAMHSNETKRLRVFANDVALIGHHPGTSF